jgi:hypothetical protein
MGIGYLGELATLPRMPDPRSVYSSNCRIYVSVTIPARHRLGGLHSVYRDAA